MKDLDMIAAENGFEVGGMKGIALVRKNLGLNHQFDIEVRRGEARRCLGFPCYPIARDLYIWGRGAKFLHEILKGDPKFQSGARNLISEYGADIDVAGDGVLLIKLRAKNLKVDTTRLRLFFIDAARCSDGMEAAAKAFPVEESVPGFAGGPTYRVGVSILMLLLIASVFAILTHR